MPSIPPFKSILLLSGSLTRPPKRCRPLALFLSPVSVPSTAHFKSILLQFLRPPALFQTRHLTSFGSFRILFNQSVPPFPPKSFYCFFCPFDSSFSPLIWFLFFLSALPTSLKVVIWLLCISSQLFNFLQRSKMVFVYHLLSYLNTTTRLSHVSLFKTLFQSCVVGYDRNVRAYIFHKHS